MTNFWSLAALRHVLQSRRFIPAVLAVEAAVIFAGGALNLLSAAKLALAVTCLAGADVIAWLAIHRR